MSEIVNMSKKVRTLVDQATASASPGESVFLEMMMTFAYTEGFKDGYAKGYTEAFLEPDSGKEKANGN